MIMLPDIDLKKKKRKILCGKGVTALDRQTAPSIAAQFQIAHLLHTSSSTKGPKGNV